MTIINTTMIIISIHFSELVAGFAVNVSAVFAKLALALSKKFAWLRLSGAFNVLVTAVFAKLALTLREKLARARFLTITEIQPTTIATTTIASEATSVPTTALDAAVVARGIPMVVVVTAGRRAAAYILLLFTSTVHFFKMISCYLLIF